MEKDREPGTARFGNFINYYSFNPPEKRLNLIPDDMLQTCDLLKEKEKLLALDVGCNSGTLTSALLTHFSTGNVQLEFLGIDIDPVLIKRCMDLNMHPGKITFDTCNVMNAQDRQCVVSKFLSERNVACFDFIFIFSVTMWIHLNNGDDGLKEFLRYVCSTTRYLVIEPQKWKCYRSAVRRMKRLDCDGFERFDSLKWRENVDKDICDYITSDACSMRLVRHFGQTEWERSLLLFESIRTNPTEQI